MAPSRPETERDDTIDTGTESAMPNKRRTRYGWVGDALVLHVLIDGEEPEPSALTTWRQIRLADYAIFLKNAEPAFARRISRKLGRAVEVEEAARLVHDGQIDAD